MDVKSPKRALAGVLLLSLLASSPICFGGLQFDGAKQYVTFGVATNLGASRLTLELWFNWTGGGVASSTGSGGAMAIPLIAKLTSEGDKSRKDGNYFLGIEAARGVLAADMEEGAKGKRPGRNHPLVGRTRITSNLWHHAAMTYDGTNCLLFLDGKLDAAMEVKEPPRMDSIQHAAVAASLKSSGKPVGFFAGTVDQVRIWNYPRSASQIASGMRERIDAAPGLIGSWPLDQTAGETALDTSGGGTQGRLIKGPVWRNDYRMTEDVTAPIKLAVVDPVRTAGLRAEAGDRVPAVFLYDSNILEQVEARFQTSFLLTRERFMAAIHEAFPDQPMGEQLTQTSEFTSVVVSFLEENKDFPLDLPLAREWVLSKSSETLRSKLTAALRAYMSGYIRVSGLPREALAGPSKVSVVPWPLGGPAPPVNLVEQRGKLQRREDLRSIRHVEKDLKELLSKDYAPLASYLAQFVSTNVVFERDLTRQRRALRTADIFAVDHYEPGELIARNGQIIDGKIRAALDELSHGLAGETVKARAEADLLKAEAERRQREAASALTTLQATAERSELKSTLFDRLNHWLLSILGVVGAVSAFTIWRLTRLKRLKALVQAPAHWHGGGVVPTMPTAELIVEPRADASLEDGEGWRERALLAERREAQSTEVVKAGLIPHLAGWLRDRLFRKALSERAELIEMQRRAALEVGELERRLEELHAPLNERLNAYEDRIAQLETQLAVKGAENRELIKAKIEMTKNRLAAIRGGSGLSRTDAP